MRGDNEKRRKICIIAHHRVRPEKFDVMSRQKCWVRPEKIVSSAPFTVISLTPVLLNYYRDVYNMHARTT